jgi:hypothetical protein
MRVAQIVSLLSLVAVAGCQSSGTSMSDAAPAMHQTILPDQVKWQTNPPTLPPGAKMAVLEGDPSKPGFFTIRGWLPANYQIPPHWHPNAERVTVISGALYLGEGDHIDEAGAQPLPAGAYSSMPAGMHHFAFTREETIIQVSSIGPWGITYVNPADDPRTKTK